MLSRFFFFFLITGVYFLILAIVMEIFIIIAERAIPTGIPTKEARAKIEAHPANISNVQYNLKS